MTTTYRPAPELAKRAKPIIAKHHQDLALHGVEPLWVWRSKAAKSKGRLVLGKARKLTGLAASLLYAAEAAGGDAQGGDIDPDESVERFVIEIAEDTWLDLSTKQKDALLDHELAHLWVDEDDDGNAVLSLRGHDVEEFASVIRRHGLWKPDLENFGAAIEDAAQLSLDDEMKVTITSSTPDGGVRSVETTASAMHDAAEKLSRGR